MGKKLFMKSEKLRNENYQENNTHIVKSITRFKIQWNSISGHCSITNGTGVDGSINANNGPVQIYANFYGNFFRCSPNFLKQWYQGICPDWFKIRRGFCTKVWSVISYTQRKVFIVSFGMRNSFLNCPVCVTIKKGRNSCFVYKTKYIPI